MWSEKILKAIGPLKAILSTAINNLVVGVVGVFLAKNTTPIDFANYVTFLTVFIITQVLWDFGSTTSILKIKSSSIISNWEKILGFKLLVLIILFVALASLLMLVNVSLDVGILLAVISSLLFSIWNTQRIKEQIEGNFNQYAKLNLQFAILRLVFSLFGLYINSVPWLIFFLYGAPSLILIVNKSSLRSIKSIKLSEDWLKILEIYKYGYSVTLSNLAYMLCIHWPVIYFKLYGFKYETAFFGAASMFNGIINIIFSTLKPFWMRKVCTFKKEHANDTYKKIARNIPLAVSVSFLLSASLSLTIYLIVGGKYQGILIVAYIVLQTMMLLGLLGIVNAFVHYIEQPKLEMYFNIFRALTIIMVFIVFKPSFTYAIILFSINLLLFEVIYTIMVYKRVIRYQHF
ncbi:hypothetical protein [Aeromonas sp. QDB63]|uniref:hypothetical protein n=1 Tax=Aeromonas sp. QDB63 TaxID=2989825 RepID=UPI0022DF19B4|nr:hypothetical protein [Aeromonas sp. QDB63]